MREPNFYAARYICHYIDDTRAGVPRDWEALLAWITWCNRKGFNSGGKSIVTRVEDIYA